jgi:hypothetical protein
VSERERERLSQVRAQSASCRSLLTLIREREREKRVLMNV